MKKIICCILLISILFAAVACNAPTNHEGTPTGTSETVVTTIATTTESQTTAVITGTTNEQSRLLSLNALDDVTKALIAEVEQTWLEEKGHALVWCDIDTKKDGVRYYGTYNDGIAFFGEGMMMAWEEKQIADSVFRYMVSFNLYFYKDGEIIMLDQAYENDLVTKEQIAEMKEIHDSYIALLYPEIYAEDFI